MTSYTDVKDPKAVHQTIVNLISANGSTVAGYYDDRLGNDDSFVENLATGVFTDVMGPQGAHDALIYGISADGGVVAGSYLNSSGNSVGFVGSVATGAYADVTGPSGAYSTLVDAISADGTIVAGYYDDDVGTTGFVDNLSTGQFTEVVDPNAAPGTFIKAISADGNIVAGYYQTSSGFIGFVENVSTGQFKDILPNGSRNSVVTSISGDGNEVAGYYLSASRGYVNFVENVTTGGYDDVVDPNATSSSLGYAISADGTTVVGNYYNDSGEFGFAKSIVTGVYTEADDPYGVQGTLVSAVSGDGSVFAGIYGDAADNTIGYVADEAACYVRGSSILTASGDVAVEKLKIGDLLVTASGRARPIRWIGRRVVDSARHPEPGAVWPVCVSAGAFGEGLPRRDLWVSPGHNIAFEGALIEARRLINGLSVVQVERDRFEYWHVELDSHDVIFAEGLPAETYLDTGNRTAFVNGGAFIDAHPDFRPKHWAETCLPLVHEGEQLVRAKARLLKRLEELGIETTTEPDLHIVADGVRIDSVRLSERRFSFLLPRACADIRLHSRTFVPAQNVAESADPRRLGVCIGRLQIDGEEIALDDEERFGEGWQDLEPFHRWTDGRAALPAKIRLIVIDVVGDGYYLQARAGASLQIRELQQVLASA